MLSFYIYPLILILANGVFGGNYQLWRSNEDENFEVSINNRYIPRDGESISFPDTEESLTVHVDYKSRFDGKVKSITCPNTWYYAPGNPSPNNYFIALRSPNEYVDWQQSGNPVEEFVEPAKICLYHTKYEHIVESGNPKKKMCCTDKPINSPGSSAPEKGASNEVEGEGADAEENKADILAFSNQEQMPDDLEAQFDNQFPPPDEEQSSIPTADDFFSELQKRRVRIRNRRNRISAKR